MPLTAYTQLAKSLAAKAGAIGLKAFTDHSFTVSAKPDRTLVTEIDKRIETFWRSRIKSAFPNHSIFGEELGQDKQNSEFTWYLDPIDGTTNFTHGIPIFCHMLALVKHDQVISSAVSFPITRDLYYAQSGRGAFLNDQPLKAVSPPAPDQLTLHIDSGGSQSSKIKLGRLHARLAGRFRTDRRMGSIAASLLPLGYHQPTAYLVTDTSPHDVIPVSLIYQEAGLTLLNLQGKPWSITDSTLIACPPSVQSHLLSCLS